MAEPYVSEGYIGFAAGVSRPCQTYFKTMTSPVKSKGRTVIVVPGGPAFGHDYLLSLRRLLRYPGIRCIVFYDPLGSGNSTQLPEKKGDRSFWNLDLLRRELFNVTQNLDKITLGNDRRYDLLGHSSGALLAAQFAGQNPPGLQRLILLNGMADGRLFNEANLNLLNHFPEHTRTTIIETEEYILGQREKLTTSRPDYIAAREEFRAKHYYRRPGELPEDLLYSQLTQLDNMESVTAFTGGVTDAIWRGSLAEETALPVLCNVGVPTLVINGEWDKASEICSLPFYDLIPDAYRCILPGTSHMSHLEDPSNFLRVVHHFLNGY